MIGLYLTLFISFLANGLFVWYILKVVKKWNFIEEVIEDHYDYLDEFEGHVDILMKTQTYSEEPLLKNLFAHVKSLVEHIKEFRKVFPEFNIVEDDKEENE